MRSIGKLVPNFPFICPQRGLFYPLKKTDPDKAVVGRLEKNLSKRKYLVILATCSESGNIGLVGIAFAPVDFKTTKPILLDSHSKDIPLNIRSVRGTF